MAQGTASQTYLTGGVGAHHTDEAYGDPYELPNERSYCETCAAIASIMFSQRMLLLTGEAKYADLLERTLYNGFLAGISLDGERYIYANPLQVRDDHVGAGNDQDYTRVPWFACACCPPNVMRLLASLEHYVALSGRPQLRLHQFVAGSYGAEVDAGPVAVEVGTDYPWRADVEVTVTESVDQEWALTVRVPHWAEGATCTVNGRPVESATADGWWSTRRHWQVGDRLVLTLPVVARLTTADPRVDAARGAVAIERGPLVYCLESTDHPGQRLDDLVLDVGGRRAVTETTVDGLPGQIVAVQLLGTVRTRPAATWWPYATVGGPADQPPESRPAERLSWTADPHTSPGETGTPRRCGSGCRPADAHCPGPWSTSTPWRSRAAHRPAPRRRREWPPRSRPPRRPGSRRWSRRAGRSPRRRSCWRRCARSRRARRCASGPQLGVEDAGHGDGETVTGATSHRDPSSS